jgi:hypothetical protein
MTIQQQVILHQALPTRFDLTQQAYRALETLLAGGRVRAYRR